jgi:23S rRNA pseudouridine1911/1915/1917 synthase
MKKQKLHPKQIEIKNKNNYLTPPSGGVICYNGIMKYTYIKTEKIRLDKYLLEIIPELSRSAWQKKIKLGDIQVNNHKVLPHHFIKTGDNIEIADPTIHQPSNNSDFQLTTIAETDDYLIINKPAGLTVHKPNPESPMITLADVLVKQFPNLANIGEHPLRPGIMHRLDKNVSGIMVIAKTQVMYIHLKQQFQSRQIKKTYLGLVYGHLPEIAGSIDFPIIRSRSGKMVARPKSQSGKEAVTLYETIKQFPHFTYLKLTPKTGRTHQIRLHLNALGHPLVGETLHIPKKLKLFKNIDRIFLHALRLCFFDLQGDWQEYKAPLPPELNTILESL